MLTAQSCKGTKRSEERTRIVKGRGGTKKKAREELEKETLCSRDPLRYVCLFVFLLMASDEKGVEISNALDSREQGRPWSTCVGSSQRILKTGGKIFSYLLQHIFTNILIFLPLFFSLCWFVIQSFIHFSHFPFISLEII